MAPGPLTQHVNRVNSTSHGVVRKKFLNATVLSSQCKWLQLIPGRVQWLDRWIIPGCPCLLDVNSRCTAPTVCKRSNPKVNPMVQECVAFLPHSHNCTWRLGSQPMWVLTHVSGCAASVSTHPGMPIIVTYGKKWHMAQQLVALQNQNQVHTGTN